MGSSSPSSVAEAGDYWGTMVRYANEFNGVRIAGTARLRERDRQVQHRGHQRRPTTSAAPALSGAWGGGLSAMHVPTGLFVQGHYNYDRLRRGRRRTVGVIAARRAVALRLLGPVDARKEDCHQWLIQAGIAKNWFGYGNTSLYGEYGEATIGVLDSTRPAARSRRAPDARVSPRSTA